MWVKFDFENNSETLDKIMPLGHEVFYRHFLFICKMVNWAFLIFDQHSVIRSQASSYEQGPWLIMLRFLNKAFGISLFINFTMGKHDYAFKINV